MELSRLNFVGTAEEFAAVEHLFVSGHTGDIEIVQDHSGSSNGEVKEQDEVIRDVIRRRPVSQGQRQLYEVLHEAGGEGVLKPALAKAMGRTDKQLDGVLGALGKRIFGTEGTGDRGILLFLEISAESGTWRYRLRPEVGEVFQAEDLI